ncbi:MAG: ATP-binding protein, partial [Syntrophales bacterium LBB04]|nr:ATP-binding protein [Syntrophales bacterium LBB04]
LATTVKISISTAEAGITLLIEDNGVGFDTRKSGAVSSHSGWGLLLMKERAESVGGRCEITSCPGSGTRICLVVPR